MTRDFESMSALETEERRWAFIGVLSFIVIAGAFSILASIYWPKRSSNLSADLILGILATTAVLILASTYFYAYRFFRDVFYLFISIGWFANALYLPFEFFIPSAAKNLQFELNIYYLGFVLNLPFFLSLFAPGSQRPDYRHVLKNTIAWFFALASASILTQYLARNFESIDGMWKFSILTLPGILFIIYIYIGVGNRIRSRATKELQGRLPVILAITFYAYAALQLAYPLKLYLRSTLGGTVLLESLFAIALVIKVTNNVSLLGVLLSTVTYPTLVATRQRLEETEERLQRRSQLEELGALAASIEHDMKTPLGAMNLTITNMRRKFQSDPQVLAGLVKLDDERKRMAAIAKVIPFLRGDKAFYDRDRFMDKVNVNEIVHRAVKSAKNELKLDPKRSFIKIDGRDVFVRAYSAMLEQVIVNVIKNSIEAIDEADRVHGVIKIHISTTKRDDTKFDKWVKIDISDNGCGITENNIPKVTTLFTTRSETKPNSGIGMFIGARIMRIHRGFIDIQSTLDEGTTVSLFLPEWSAYLRNASQDFSADEREMESGEMAREIVQETSATILPDVVVDA